MGPDLNQPLNLLLFVGLMLLIGLVAAEIEHRSRRRPGRSPEAKGDIDPADPGH
jgi:hypothetical protein